MPLMEVFVSRCLARRGGWLLLLGLIPALAAPAQSMEGGARAAALGGAATALPGEAWGHANPGAWATLPGRAVAFHASQAFGLTELRLGALQYVEPTRLGAFALGARTFGFEDYRETFFTVGYARSFDLGAARSFHAGVTLRYHQVRITDYGSAGGLGLSLGWLVPLLPTLHVGFHATNLNAPSLAEGAELPRTFALGLSYLPAAPLRLLLDAHKDVRFPLSVRAGLEFQPVDVLFLRTGLTTEPTRFTAGAGIRAGRALADVAAERHAELGWSPAVSLGLQW